MIRFQQPRGLRPRSAATYLLRSWVRIPLEAWIFVCCECLLSGRGLCDKLITRPEKPYRLWYVVVCDLETSRMRRPWPALGRSSTGKNPLNMLLLLSFLFFLNVLVADYVCLKFLIGRISFFLVVAFPTIFCWHFLRICCRYENRTSSTRRTISPGTLLL